MKPDSKIGHAESAFRDACHTIQRLSPTLYQRMGRNLGLFMWGSYAGKHNNPGGSRVTLFRNPRVFTLSLGHKKFGVLKFSMFIT